MDEEGITGEVIFPNTLPPFYDILAHLSGVPRDDRTSNDVGPVSRRTIVGSSSSVVSCRNAAAG